MTDLADQSSIDGLSTRFAGFFDAVLVEAHLQLPRGSSDRRGSVQLLAQDVEGLWCDVTLTVQPLREYKFAEGPRTSHRVLSDGLVIHLLDDGVFLDLGPYTDQPVAPDDLRRSHQYLFGGSCSVEVAEAPE